MIGFLLSNLPASISCLVTLSVMMKNLLRVIGMVKAGTPRQHVVANLCISQSVIGRACKRFQDYGSVAGRHGDGWQCATTCRQDQNLLMSATRNRLSNSSTPWSEFHALSGTPVSTHTVRNKLHQGGFRAKRPEIRVPLKPHHQQHRHQWA